MSYTATTIAPSYTAGIFAEFAANATDIVPIMVVLVIVAVVMSLLTSIFGLNITVEGEEEIEQEFVRELPDRNEYEATLECQNCRHEQKIPIVKGYDIEEAIKIGDYFCKVCGSKKLKRKKAYWD